jgi:hypothetical protein
MVHGAMRRTVSKPGNTPGISGKTRSNGLVTFCPDDEENLFPLSERSAEMYKTLRGKLVHECGVFCPLCLLPHRQRRIPVRSAGTPDGKGRLHRVTLARAVSSG